MPMKPRELEKLVFKQGFKLVTTAGKGSHRRYIHPDGRTTEIPFHKGKELRPRTQANILKDIGLN